MAIIELDLTKDVNANAAVYFEKAKKCRHKLKGAEEALAKSKEKLSQLLKKNSKELEKAEKEVKIEREKKWYEKFRWFISSEGFLCIGGRDATSNEIIIKKHTEKNDIVFHTEAPGSPFFCIKTEGKKVNEDTLNETAIATASYSRAWKLGLGYLEVFYVNPEQVSKQAMSGEYIGRGAFMIYGKKNKISAQIGLAIGITKESAIMGGALSAIKKNCEKYVEIRHGKEKASKVAKQIQHFIGGDLDEIIRNLPSGGCELKK